MSSDDIHRGDPIPGPSRPAVPPPPPPPAAGSEWASAAPGHGQPGYGQVPGYPPGYGPPGYAPPGYPPPAYARPTNTMAILALVTAFVFAPAGLVLGIIARRQIRQTGEQGDGLALAGIVIGAIATALFVLLIVIWLVAFATFAGSVDFAP